MTDADMLKRIDFLSIIRDAELFVVLIDENRTMGLRERAARMKSNFIGVSFPGNIAPAAAKYFEAIGLACDGSYIDPKVVPEIEDFRQMLEDYRAIC